MNNIVDKIQKCVFFDTIDAEYLNDLKGHINDTNKMRKLLCDFEAPTKKSARKLCFALQQVGFEAYPDDFEERIINANKDVTFDSVHDSLNIAVYEAWKHKSEILMLMVEQDKNEDSK